MDAGANICLTGDLDILTNAINTPPLAIIVALHGDNTSFNDCCTKMGYIPLALTDRTIHWQQCFYLANAVETIISPQAILLSSDVFASWSMMGYIDSRPGTIRFDSHDGFFSMIVNLECCDGLYYCPNNLFTLGQTPVLHGHDAQTSCPPSIPVPKVHCIADRPPPQVLCCSSHFEPTSKARQLESKVWLLCLGFPGVQQLDVLPQNATGIPAVFEYHPFCCVDFKEQACIRKQAAQRSAVQTTDCCQRFYMDFGFMHASTLDYSHCDKTKDHVVLLYDGFLSYLLIVDAASRYVWVFLTHSKSPPLDIVSKFL
jgi:hypothetical protein